MRERTRKTASSPRQRSDELTREYRFDYSKSRSSRFSRKFPKDAAVIVLDSDVARFFRDSKRVNSLLRATIAAVEKPRSRRAG